jgi:hypothetical protein
MTEVLVSAMSNVDQYAASVVEEYHVAADTESPSHRAADELVPLIKQWGKQFLQGITLSGAYAKKTAVSLYSDVDVLIALKPVPGKEMKNIFWSLFEFLSDHDVPVQTWAVSMQVKALGMKVDLIPAYRERGSGCVLFNKKTGGDVHTDLTQHVRLVGNSGRQQEICALKIWRERNKLDLPSLYLELTVLKALESQLYGQLTHNVAAVLRYIGNRFEQVEVRDPANEDNVVSNDLRPRKRRPSRKPRGTRFMTRTGRRYCGKKDGTSYVSISAIRACGAVGRDVASNVSAERLG